MSAAATADGSVWDSVCAASKDRSLREHGNRLAMMHKPGLRGWSLTSVTSAWTDSEGHELANLTARQNTAAGRAATSACGNYPPMRCAAVGWRFARTNKNEGDALREALLSQSRHERDFVYVSLTTWQTTCLTVVCTCSATLAVSLTRSISKDVRLPHCVALRTWSAFWCVPLADDNPKNLQKMTA